jgi:predicted RNA binding protein YcfA (HicA-like mRNA interferase family)
VKRLSGKEMCKVLERHGWRLDRIEGSHHVYKKPGHPGTPSVPVHGTKILKPKTQRNIMRSAGLTDDDRS